MARGAEEPCRLRTRGAPFAVAHGRASAVDGREATTLLDYSATTCDADVADEAMSTAATTLGDRLVRRAKRRKSADAFLAELATLSPGDLVVHTDHGIGRYVGLTQVPVAKAPHDCVQLEYAGGDKLYVPVENLEVLSRYGSGEEGASLTASAARHGSAASRR